MHLKWSKTYLKLKKNNNIKLLNYGRGCSYEWSAQLIKKGEKIMKIGHHEENCIKYPSCIKMEWLWIINIIETNIY